MPCLKGAVNYKNDILINIISEILPNGEYGWQAVSFAYHEQSKEKDPRNTDNLKRHWIKTLCNGTKKPTGKPGGPDDRIHRCISIEKRIMDKTHSGMPGLSSDDEDDAPRGSGAGEDDDPFGEESVGGGASEVESKVILMGHPISCCHAPVFRSFFIHCKMIISP